MYQAQGSRVLTKEAIESYTVAMREDGKSTAMVTKYTCDLNMAADYFAGAELTKQVLIRMEKHSGGEICSNHSQLHLGGNQWRSETHWMERFDD